MAQRRGFGALTPERRAEIASQGGRAAHARGTAHRFTKDEAAVAGRKGGIASARRKDAAVSPATPSTDPSGLD